MTLQHEQFLEQEVARLKVVLLEQNQQEIDEIKLIAEHETKKRILGLEEELNVMRQNAQKEISQMRYEAEQEIAIKKQVEQHGWNMISIALGTVILILFTMLVNNQIELRKYRATVKAEYVSPKYR